MVGILAMSASLEEYGCQPCKKSRKDEEAPIKTITNYFSPVSKNTEKVLSSPRSNNIADYFKQNSPINEKKQTSKAENAAIQQDTPQAAVADSSAASGKPSKCRKRTNLTKRLGSLTPEAVRDLGVQKGINKDLESENVCGKTGFMGSDTAALLAAICSNKGDLQDRIVCSPGSSTPEVKDTLNNAASNTDTNIQSKLRKPKQTKVKNAQSNTVQKKQDCEPGKPFIISGTSLDSTGDTMDSSLPVNVDGLHGKDSILVVSFEEFIKSQGEKDMESSLEGKDLTPSLSGEDVPNENPLRNEDWAQKPSPKTVTVHAQIHVSPPHSYSATTVPKKLASIFLKKKDSEVEKKAVELVSEHESVDFMVQNRKSNVVVLEDDLELAVVEVENLDYAKQKSTVVERQQFMKAFRQPGEAGKSVVKKSLSKNKSLADIPAQEGFVEGQQRTSAKKVGTEVHQIKEGANNQEETPKSKDVVGVKKKCTSKNAGKNPTLKGKKLKEPSSGACKASNINLRRSSRLQTSETPALNSPVKGHSMIDLPLQMSTPKGRIPCRKSDIYRAEVISISTEANSPIRMRFTRLSTRASGKNKSLLADVLSTPRSNKVVASSKKIDKAKKLLEKAKSVQQNIAKPETPRRLSSRQTARAADKKVLQESILIVDESSSKARKVHEPGRKKRLRSVNDVLGKREKIKKTANLSTGQSTSSGKKLKKQPSITVIDDGPEISENSVDEEQFKAKREFLKSGLPDSLKRHIAKTTALLEAYALSGSSFQNVVHVQQRDDCQMWHMPLPPCPHLTDFDDQSPAVPDVAKLTLSLGEFTCVKDKLAIPMAPTMVNKRQVFSDAARDLLLEEIRFSNPQFPVKRFLSMFLKKQSDSVALLDTYKPGFQPQPTEAVLLETGTRGKRKRKDSPGNKSKRKRSAGKAEEQNEICDLTSSVDEASSQPSIPTEICGLVQRGQKCLERKTISELDIHTQKIKSASKDTECDDVLWTEKYQPQNTSEMIGNSAAIQQLHSWLKDWKVRAEKEEKSQMQKTEKEKSDTWDQNDFMTMDSDSEEESLCNTVLITGPPGIGKTAAVYACAQELGFKVFEVNASCQRSGRQILTQLKEATQSHQVDQQGVNTHKPCFFSSFSSTKSPRKLNSPKNVVSSPRKPPASPRGTGLRKGLAPKSLANFFKPPAIKRNEEKPSATEASKGLGKGVFLREVETKPNKSLYATAQKETGSEEKHRKTATSLILFEEVDVIFDDDVGFLSAIKTFMSTTKRPVILTTSDPTFGLMFDGFFENIHFKTPSLVNVATYLQVLCLAENLRTETKDFLTFLSANKCDIRQSLLHLQFWASSGGGGLVEKPLQICRSNTDGLKKQALIGAELPKCNIGCTENFMGLHNIILPTDGLLSFIKNHVPQTQERNVLQRLLTEFQMNNVYFTLSNLEFLLPLPVNIQLPTLLPPLPENSAGLDKNDKADESPLKVSAQMKKRKKLLLFNDSDLFDSDSVDEMLSLVSGIQSQEETGQKDLPEADREKSEGTQPAPERHRLSQEEQKASRLVYRCLGSLADFVDNMSQIDCFTYNPKDQADFGNANWTESRIKDGLCDGLRVETRDWSNSQSSGEVRATIETLAFQKCLSKLSTAIDTSLEACTAASHDPTKALTLHVSEERGNVCFCQSAASSSVAEKRMSVVRTVLSSRSFFGLGNRQANVTEYLPAMRCICRLQRLKEQEKTKRRFLHYFEGIHLELSKATVSSLAADFP
ncbi:ATPase family AAA domain-containing protein 5 isoform X2 [Xenopus laevis]|uniref:ATPase family AAA domain-containing protein 5 isoform X2 n=2 Tax=Xenopus laevis TaxID=8355 RepID=A0A1L8EV17_XENLA|nr:ATPase family AAA domain-containing protein 5 isoform X2 [Xenopus laevis]OCT63196.1 hypothetical protein XELAEV_18044294mg [Xenopus laevis]